MKSSWYRYDTVLKVPVEKRNEFTLFIASFLHSALYNVFHIKVILYTWISQNLILSKKHKKTTLTLLIKTSAADPDPAQNKRADE